MSRKRIFIYGLLILLAAGVFYYHPYLENLYLLSRERIQDLNFNPLSSLAETAQKEISAPPPLRAEKESARSFLTQKGVIGLTNEERKKNEKKILIESSELDRAAEKKARDIFEKQYFAHVSPSGNGPDYFVSASGYQYITIGENLALGNFADDQELVAAWVASPGHRENILREQFQEIGVAVVRGNFEGNSTWIAVQEFGAPLSACPEADAGLKRRIDTNTAEISQLSGELGDKLSAIKSTSPRDPDYGRMADGYNTLVGEYNALVAKTKGLIESYNSQVNKYNTCVKRF